MQKSSLCFSPYLLYQLVKVQKEIISAVLDISLDKQKDGQTTETKFLAVTEMFGLWYRFRPKQKLFHIQNN